MRILSRSVFGSFLAAFLLAFLVISLVLTVGLLAPLAGYFMKGVGLQHLLRLFAIGFHETLQLTVPIALFFSGYFVFFRLKTDGELDAMSACGIRLWSVASGPVAFAVLVSGLFLWMNGELLPREHALRRTIRAEMLLESGFSLVNPGETVTAVPGMRFRFDAREGDSMRGLVAQEFGSSKVPRLLTAERARLAAEETKASLELDDMALDPLDDAKRLRLSARRFRYRLNRRFAANFRYALRDKDLPTLGLIAYMRRARTAKKYASAGVEFGRRIAYALAPFGFVLLGIALGARARRGDLVRGPAVALGALLGYYLYVLFMIELHRLPALHPEILIYLLPIAVVAAGLVLMEDRR